MHDRIYLLYLDNWGYFFNNRIEPHDRIFNFLIDIYILLYFPSFPSISDMCSEFFFLFGTAARGTLQDVKRERPNSRFAAVQTLNPENPTKSP